MKLRPYQKESINQLRTAFSSGHKRVILCAPTGAGKTVMFSEMVRLSVEKENKVLIVTDRKELLTQSGGALQRFNIKSSSLTPKTKKVPTSQVTIAMVETLARRLKKEEYMNWFKQLDLIIFDEAHKQNFDKLFEHMNKNTFVIGATATPHRDGNQKALINYYTKIISSINVSGLISLGFLAKPRSFGVPIDLSKVKTIAGDFDANQVNSIYEENKVYEGVVDNYKRICSGKKTLAFSGNIASSKRLLDTFLKSGLNARHLDSTMSKEERVDIISWYKSTKDAILCNVGILTTGFDAPTTEVIILYRATTSLPLFLQMCGRGSRVTDGKDCFFILDFGDNIKRLDYWEKDREWSLISKRKKTKKEEAAVMKECKQCQSLISSGLKICPFCGYESKRDKKKGAKVELIEMRNQYKNMPKHKILNAAKVASWGDLVKMTKAKLIKPFWVIYNCFEDYNKALLFTRALGYKDGWLWYQTKGGNFTHLK
jgi:superfamily II DNA or RNA helicase